MTTRKEKSPPRWALFFGLTATVAGRTVRSDGRGDAALEEGEVADGVRRQLDPVGDVVLDPRGGHGGRCLGLVARLPQADRQAPLVSQVGHAVTDESGLILELAEHPCLGGVGNFLEGALRDFVCRDANVLHGSSPFAALVVLELPETNSSQIE